MGSAFISLLALFFIGFFFLAVKNFSSDTDTLNSNIPQVRSITSTERELIRQWAERNNISFDDGYRSIIQKYPSRPWLHQ